MSDALIINEDFEGALTAAVQKHMASDATIENLQRLTAGAAGVGSTLHRRLPSKSTGTRGRDLDLHRHQRRQDPDLLGAPLAQRSEERGG